jgi:RIP metalloprotease RseP
MFLNFLQPVLIILGVIVIFNLMIIVHELGHFLAARWRGLVIEKFGIWFGKPLWKKTINGVEYSLGCIPAGGFVALPQLAPMEVMEGKVETPREQLPPISALDKIIVAFAGPLFSLLLAVVFATIVWKVGRPVGEAESTKIVGAVVPKSPAAEAGILPGDEIESVDGHKVNRFGGMGADSVMWRVIRSEGATVAVEVKRNGKLETFHPKPVVPEKSNWWNRKNLRQIGIVPKVSAVVGKVHPGSQAAALGIRAGDVITQVNGRPIFDNNDIYEETETAKDGAVTLTVDRGGETFTVRFQPSTVRAVDVQRPGFIARLFGAKGDSPAAQAGLQKNDVIVELEGEPVTTVAKLMKDVAKREGTPVKLLVRRGEKELHLTVTPRMAELPNGESRAIIGFTPAQNDGMELLPMGKYKTVWPNPIEQIRGGVMSIVNTLDAVLSRKSSVSVQHMGGPVMMMNAYYTILSGPEGIRMALWFSVVLNVNLALLNMLPIPVLDGGHITLAIIESIRRRPVNVRILEFVQTACALTIIGFMVFIAFFDVQDLPFMGGKQSGAQFKKVPAAEVQK